MPVDVFQQLGGFQGNIQHTWLKQNSHHKIVMQGHLKVRIITSLWKVVFQQYHMGLYEQNLSRDKKSNKCCSTLFRLFSHYYNKSKITTLTQNLTMKWEVQDIQSETIAVSRLLYNNVTKIPYRYIHSQDSV